MDATTESALPIQNQEEPIFKTTETSEAFSHKRFQLSKSQRNKLEKAYNEKQEPSSEDFKLLTEAMGLSENCFGNRFEQQRKSEKKRLTAASEEQELEIEAADTETEEVQGFEPRKEELPAPHLAAITSEMFQTFTTVLMAFFLDWLNGLTLDQIMAIAPNTLGLNLEVNPGTRTETVTIAQQDSAEVSQGPGKIRKKFTEAQNQALLEEYKKDASPSLTSRTQLAAEIKLTRKQVDRWFQSFLKRKAEREGSMVGSSSDEGDVPQAKRLKEDIEA
ncbi:hypothetical protein L596_000638 [Steinernema carpocapsae]|uniref:Homeobox domain-containing protein n=1 Tax=Steinernema carpocapsae TaxID=34508 RepID=A0A4U8UMX2_STECR|nr:hypothetical protein L596_000638 [Steinernema carpocapsae]